MAIVCLPLPAFTQPPGLTAPVANTRIRLRAKLADDSTPVKPKAELQFMIDREPGEFGPFDKNQQFAVKSSRGVAITFERFNPLSNAVSIVIDDVPDPSAETLGKLVDSLQSVSTILGGTAGSSGRGALLLPKNIIECKDQFEKADGLLESLTGALNDEKFSSTKIKGAIEDASKAITGGFGSGGAAAVQAGVNQLDGFLGTDDQADSLRGKLTKAKKVVSEIESIAKRNDTQGCDAMVHHIYLLAMAAYPGERVSSMERVVKAFADIIDYLKPYSDTSRWSQERELAAEYIVRTPVVPTSSTMKKVKVTYSTRVYEASAAPGILTVRTVDTGTAEFTLRRYSAWTPEIGVGVTFNKVDRPVYGTGKNAAGQTVIALSQTDKSTKVDPTVLVNFVCGFCGLTQVTPMFQVGTSTSKTTPAILLGGGLRFFATSKGEFAFGFGAILPWAKQLKNEDDLGKVIDGTAAVEEHLEWRIVKGFHSYITLQYKF